jgi:tetratricopeptide (TPR) repeat protein
MDSSPTAPILDVPRLVESSRPARSIGIGYWVIGGFVLVMVISLAVGNESATSRAIVSAVWAVGMLAVLSASFIFSIITVNRFRNEQRRVEQIGELVAMKRWPEAVAALDAYLSNPARTHSMRAQALLHLSTVVARYHRFEDAIAIQTRLLDEGMLEENSAAMLRIARAMAMLREDHLFDADRAITELRRSVAAGSAGASLIEIYRDVKTGHPDEAIEMFERELPKLRDQLGHRSADAWGLIARAYDLRGRDEDAARAFRNATLLAPQQELFARYPEVEKLSGRYQPAAAPPEAA